MRQFEDVDWTYWINMNQLLSFAQQAFPSQHSTHPTTLLPTIRWHPEPTRLRSTHPEVSKINEVIWHLVEPHWGLSGIHPVPVVVVLPTFNIPLLTHFPVYGLDPFKLGSSSHQPVLGSYSTPVRTVTAITTVLFGREINPPLTLIG